MRGVGLAIGAVMLLSGAADAHARSAPRPSSSASAADSARAVSRAFSAVASAVGPAVVRLEMKVAGRDATASGIVIDTAGNIITTSHALDGATSVSVVLLDERRLQAAVIGRDPRTDVALLRLQEPPRDLTAARFGDSDLVQVGEWVLAIGSPLGLDQSATAGIVSGRSRTRPDLPAASPVALDLIQTDANISAGSAGGPLVNLDGEVIGLSASGSRGSGAGYGFAVPINQVRRVAQMLGRDGQASHPYMGVGLLDVADLDAAERGRLGTGLPARGAVVSRIWKDAPAARAGLRPGDVITSINNQEIPAPEAVAAFVSSQAVGTRLVVGFVRGGHERTLRIALDSLPPADDSAGAGLH